MTLRMLALAVLLSSCRKTATPVSADGRPALPPPSSTGAPAPAPSASLDAAPDRGPPATDEISAGAEEGFADVVLRIVDRQPSSDGGTVLRAVGSHRGATVALTVRLGSSWRKVDRIPAANLDVRKDTVFILRRGPDDDAMLRALAELYGVPAARATMRDSTQFTAVSLEGDPSRIDAGPVKLKLFYEAPTDEDSAEAFLNIDGAAQRLALREKDPEYRGALVRALTAAR